MSLDVIRCHWMSLDIITYITCDKCNTLYITHTTYLAWPYLALHHAWLITVHHALHCTVHKCAVCIFHIAFYTLRITHCTLHYITWHGMAWHYIHGNTIFYILHSLSLYLSAMRIIHINPTHHPIKPGLILLVAITLCLILVQQWHQTPSTNMVGPCEPPCISLHHMGTVYQICGSIFRGMASDPRMAKTIFLVVQRSSKLVNPTIFCVLFLSSSSMPVFLFHWSDPLSDRSLFWSISPSV